MGGADGTSRKEIVVVRPMEKAHRVMISPNHHLVAMSPS